MRLDRVQALLSERSLDGLVATSCENVAYLSGAVIVTQRLIPERLAAVVLPLELEPTLVVCTVEESLAVDQSRIRAIRAYVEFVESPVAAITGVVREKKLERGRWGIETKTLSAHHYRELRELVPEAELVPVDDLLSSLRMIKSPEEIDLMKRAAISTDRAIRSAFTAGGSGIRDKVIADQLAQEILSGGADSIAFLVLGAGPTASQAHPTACDRPLREGDVVRCDVGGTFSGYHSDLARTAVVGRASHEQKCTYEKLWQVHEALISQVRPGVLAKDLFNLCRDLFRDSGLRFESPHVGHSIGLGLHEKPILNPLDETVLEEGMALAIEPVCWSEEAIFHVEDLVIVTADGADIVSRSADWSQLLVISA